MGIYPVALTSASLQSARYFGFFPGNFMLRTTETRDYRLIRISGGTDIFRITKFHLGSAAVLSRCGTSASLCIERRRRARVREALARASFCSPESCGTSPTFVSRVRTSRERRARRAARLPSGVTRSCHRASERRKPRHGKHPPGERARVSRASAVSRHAFADWLTACVLSHFASHTPAEPDPELPAAPVFAVSVPSRFCATQQVAKKNRDSLAPSSERAAVAFVRSTVEVRASAPE